MGEFPVVDGSPSNLTVNCATVHGSTGTNVQAEAISDYTNVAWHSGAGRAITLAVTAHSTAATITVGVQENALDVNHAVAAVKLGGLPADEWIVAETGASVTLGIAPPKNATIASIVENGPGRTLPSGGGVYLANSTNTLTTVGGTLATGNFNAGDVGMTVEATDLPEGTTISSVTNANHALLSNNASSTATADCTSGCEVSIVPNTATDNANPQSSSRIVEDVHFSSGSAAITSASANFQPSDVGLLITSLTKNLIPAATYILSFTNATHVTMSANAGATQTGSATNPFATSIGVPSSTAPASGQYVSQLATELTENPALVSGARPCTEGVATGALLDGVWENPNTKTFTFTHKGGGFDFSGTNAGQASPAIGQILYETSVVTFASYVVQTALAPSPSANSTYQVVFPFLPTALGICPGGDNAASYSFIGETVNQSLLPSGTGRPDSAAVRGIASLNAPSGSLLSTTPTPAVQTYDLTGGGLPYINAYSAGPFTCNIVRPAPLSFASAYPCHP